MPQSLAVRATDSLARVREIVDQIVARDHSGEIITALHHIPAREAQWAAMPDWVRPELAAAYSAKGITQLYSHQRAAADIAHDGRNVVVVTPTASGKTLCYNLPVINAVLANIGYAGAVSFSHEGAGAGPARRASRSGASVSITRSEFSLMMATLPPTRAKRFAKKGTSS